MHATPMPTPAARWRLRLLGGFEIDDGQQRRSRLHSRAAVLLLARLALRPGRDHGREELAALLWPQADLGAGLARLRQTLSTLRAVLERGSGLAAAEALIAADRRVLRLVPGTLTCDVWPFERACADGDAAEARRLYAGELLPGYQDEWVAEERLRLQALADRLITQHPARRPATELGEPVLIDPPALGERAPPTPHGDPALALPKPVGLWHGDGQALQRLEQLVSCQRLVTLRGPGGIGKTRLALELLQSLAAMAAPFDTLRFVPCVQVRQLPELQDRLMLALRPPPGPQDDLARCTQALAGHRALLVLDNADALEGPALQWMSQALERLPGLHMVLTSRRASGLPGEHDWPVMPLSLPASGASWPELRSNPAVCLFVDRACASRLDFQLHAGNGPTVAAVVRRLQGLPLAIELAASRVRSLPPAALLELLNQPGSDRWALLSRSGPRAGDDPRHASLLAVVDDSLAQLQPETVLVLAMLAVAPVALAGDLVGRLAVRTGAAASGAAARRALDDLAAASLVDPLIDDGVETWWALREPVRDRVRETRALPVLRGWPEALMEWAQALPQPWPLSRLTPLWPVLTWLANDPLDAGTAPGFIDMVLALHPAWAERSPPAAVVRALDRALDALPRAVGLDTAGASHGDRRAQAHALAAWLGMAVGERGLARDHAARAAACWPSNAGARARAQWQVAKVWRRADGNVDQARMLLHEAVRHAQVAGDKMAEAEAVNQLATIANEHDGKPAQAEAGYRQALELLRAVQPPPAHAIRGVQHNLAITLIYAGRPADALAVIAPLIADARANGDEQLLGPLYNARGSALQDLGHLAEAMESTIESLTLAWHTLETESVLYALWNVALLAHRLELADVAARLLGYADASWRHQFGPLGASDRRDVVRVRRRCRQRLGRQMAEAIWRDGQSMSPADAVACARRLAPATTCVVVS